LLLSILYKFVPLQLLHHISCENKTFVFPYTVDLFIDLTHYLDIEHYVSIRHLLANLVGRFENEGDGVGLVLRLDGDDVIVGGAAEDLRHGRQVHAHRQLKILNGVFLRMKSLNSGATTTM
jgi:hypothetical protein